jgi:1-acyl-sn-glycerol-3-phosphate acyltransferase
MALLTVLGVFYLLFRAHLLIWARSLRTREGILEWVTERQVLISRKIFLLCRMLTRFRLSVQGYDGGKLPPVLLLVCNHQSLVDIPVLMATFPRQALRFVTKKELGKGIPYISLALRVGGHALISRTGDFRKGRDELLKLADRSAQGISPAVFPEGHRSRTGELGTFHAGAFRMILDRAPLPVLSVAVYGGYRIGKLQQLLTNLGRTHYRVKALTVYPPPKGKKEILDVLARAEQEISRQVAVWQAEEKAEGKKRTRPPGR